MLIVPLKEYSMLFDVPVKLTPFYERTCGVLVCACMYVACTVLELVDDRHVFTYNHCKLKSKLKIKFRYNFNRDSPLYFT